MPLSKHALFLRGQADNYRRSAALFKDAASGQMLKDMAARCDDRADALLARNGWSAEK